MIHPLHDFSLEKFLQIFQIEHHTRDRIGLTRNRYFERVVVPVTVRIVALSKDAAILLGRKGRIMVKVRSGKLDFACQVNHISAYLDAPAVLTGYSLPFQDTFPLA